ncbi:MAG TPA: PH domain-containing protein [Thermoanaerobaculia bacterium]|nr:PH domain-containing protein [Thermoanaerobaculia bacterium]
MSDWRDAVVRLMRVPPEPAPPPGSAPRVFRAAPNFYYFKLITWFAGHILAVVVIVPPILALTTVMPREVPMPVVVLFWIIAIGGSIALLLRVTLGYAIVRLDYEMRWYMISDRAIRIREGIITVREKTIALANIQNTVVKQGPLQRILGIADVEVRTAGGGSGRGGGENGKGGQIGEPMHVGYFRGVDNAAEIREVILAGVRRHRDSGLGDPDDHRAEIDPAARLLQETRALREILETWSAADLAAE